MVKSLIIPVISIAYILSIGIIADAKVKRSIPRIDREQTCENQKANPAQDSKVPIADIRAICQLIANQYREVDINYSKHQSFVEKYPEKLRPDLRVTGIITTEITSLNLVSYIEGINARAKIQIVFNRAVYDWNRNKKIWEVDDTSAYKGEKIEVELYKINGKWSRDSKNVHWNNDMKNAIESNQGDI